MSLKHTLALLPSAQYGMSLEDLVIVTGNGAENLNSFTKELTTVS